MSDKIRELQRQIDNERNRMSRCHHDFGEPFDNPEKTRVVSGYETIRQGVDSWQQPSSWRDKYIQRWTRTCKKCGYEQHTKKSREHTATLNDNEVKLGNNIIKFE